MLRWCERHGVDYLVGLAKNSRLLALAAESMQSAAAQFASTQEKQRHFAWLDYAAGSWDRARRVIAKAEHSAQGANPRLARPPTSLPIPFRHLGRDQPRRRRAAALRRSLLRARRDGKPDQRATARALCRPHQLPLLVGQSVPPA